MRIGIIGAGNIGATLAAQLVLSGGRGAWPPSASPPVYTADLTLDAARQALARATPDQTTEWRRRPPAAIAGR